MKLATQPEREAGKGIVPPAHNSSVQKIQKGVTCQILDREDYPEWDELVDKSPHGTIFHYSWWLQTTAANFKIHVVRNEKGALVAGLPIPFQKRRFLRLFHSPLLTPYLGPVFDLSAADNICDKPHLTPPPREQQPPSGKSFATLRAFARARAPHV